MKNSIEILEKLKDKGCRSTKARKAILELILAADGPFSAREIAEGLAKEQVLVNRATLYRELSFLKEEGIIRELALDGRVRHYEAMTEHRHGHAVCLRCHKVECMEMEEMPRVAEGKRGAGKRFKVMDFSLEMFGLCADCNKD